MRKLRRLAWLLPTVVFFVLRKSGVETKITLNVRAERRPEMRLTWTMGYNFVILRELIRPRKLVDVMSTSLSKYGFTLCISESIWQVWFLEVV